MSRVTKTPYDLLLEQIQKCRDSETPVTPLGESTQHENHTSVGRYTLHEILGKGSFSKVQLATHQLTKEKVAVKIIDKTKTDAAARRLIFREMSVLDKLHHPNIIRLYEVIESLTQLNIVMEYAAGGDLETRIQKKGAFTDSEGKIIFAQLVAAIKHMHDNNIVHRDIKAENVFFAVRSPIVDPKMGETNNLSDAEVPEASTAGGPGFRGRNDVQKADHKARATHSRMNYEDRSTRRVHNPSLAYSPDLYRVKIGDFGFSKTITTADQHLITFCGSPPYAAPELFNSSSYLGPPVDMWAMGVLLYYMLMGFLPFRGRTVGQLRKLILEASSSGTFPVPPQVSEGAAELIRRLLSRNPKSRPRAAKLIEEAKKASSTTRPLSMDRLVAVSTPSSWRKSEPWLAHQVFPTPYPTVSATDSVGGLGGYLLLAEAGKKASQIILSTAGRPDRPLVHKARTETSPQPRPTPRISITLAESSTDVPVNSTSSEPELSTNVSAFEEAIVQSEMEAAKLLLQLGISSDRLRVPYNNDARNSISGAYRIMLHQLQRYRRLSNLPSVQDRNNNDDNEQKVSTETSSMEEVIPAACKGKSRMKKSASDIPGSSCNRKSTDKSCSLL
ncbi:serine:threonine protein kinase NIM1 [Echinococcus multilocularis]|uniref:non-specific serine/threonine protein kinase n=1 Tax=Echinococcus multilocularis TaxID=6211 RepID=A0A068YE99_ECHMU|nr:serine:threonine protein kinase NIM1 [Echinococcus multilocularis]